MTFKCLHCRSRISGAGNGIGPYDGILYTHPTPFRDAVSWEGLSIKDLPVRDQGFLYQTICKNLHIAMKEACEADLQRKRIEVPA